MTKQLIAAGLLAAFGTVAFAQEAYPDTTWLTPSSTKSRTDVGAELAQAKADGSIKSGDIGYNFVAKFSTKSREQVKAETMAAKASGEFDAINKEGYGMAAALRGAPVYANTGSNVAQK